MLALGAPLAVAQAVQFLINATEVVLIGRLGPQSLAGIALGHSVHFTVVMFCLGVTVTVSPLVARALGHGDARLKAAPILHQGLWVATLLGVPGTILTWHGGLLLTAFGQSPDVVALASEYLRPLSLSMVPSLWFVAFRAFVAAHSKPRPVLLVTIAGLIFNAVISTVMIFGHLGVPALGLVGAGIGITATNTFMCLGLALYLLRAPAFRAYRLFHNMLQPNWPIFREIWKVGIPIGGATMLEVAYFNVCLQLMGRIGTDELAAHQVALQLAAISFMVPLGFGQAATVRVGFNAGAGDRAAAARAGWMALILGLIGVSIAALLFLALPRQLIGLFMPLDNPANARAIGFAVTFLMVVAAFQLVDETQTIMLGALRGLKDTRVPMVLAAFGYWVVGLSVTWWLGFHTPLGGVGIWIGSAFGLLAAALLLTLRFYRMAHYARA
jgi:MATE family multidrug resistance protein